MKQAGLLLLFGFSACVANTASATTAVKAKGDSSIAGQIQYPAKVVPAMKVCALNTKTQVTSCIKTKVGQTKYLIQGLVTAEYQVLANLTSSELRVVGHMLQVQLKPLAFTGSVALIFSTAIGGVKELVGHNMSYGRVVKIA